MKVLFEKACAAASHHNAKNVLVALGSGRTARKAREAFPGDYRLFAVTNRAGVVRGDDGENEAVSGHLVRELESDGVRVIECDASPFQHIARGTQKLRIGEQDFDFRQTWKGFPDFDQVLREYPENRNFNPICLLLNFCDWFGAGFQVAMEIMLLASDSGQLPLDEKVISIVSPYEPRPACYVVMTPCRTEEMLSTGPEILPIELMAKE